MRFSYENKVFKHENAEKPMMNIVLSNTNGILKLEKLRYNYNVPLKEGKKANIYGLIKD